MIIDCKVNQNKIELLTDKGVQSITEYNVSKVIFDEHNILCISFVEDTVWLLNDEGKCICEISNTDNVYIMYIQKHPRFGLCITASINDGNNNWQDQYLTYINGEFRTVSIAR